MEIFSDFFHAVRKGNFRDVGSGKSILTDRGHLVRNGDIKDCRTIIKRAKTYTGEVYDGDNLIGMITYTVKNKLGGDNADFDDLF